MRFYIEQLNEKAMKKIAFLVMLTVCSIAVFAQPEFDLGVKAGLNNSKITTNVEEFSSENINNFHIGAFARLGVGRIYFQPEAYFSSKGGDLKEIVDQNPVNTVSSFNYNSVDVPLLLGVKILKGDAFNLRAMGGPVFGFLTSGDVHGDNRFSEDYFRDSFYGWQYGVGIDAWFLTFDARIENSRTSVYESSDLNSKSKVLLLTLGIKLF